MQKHLLISLLTTWSIFIMHKKLFLMLFFSVASLSVAALRPCGSEVSTGLFSPSSITDCSLAGFFEEEIDVSFPEPPLEALFCIDPVLTVNTDTVVLKFTKADIEAFSSDDYLNECIESRNKQLLYFHWLPCASLGHLRDADSIAVEDENALLLDTLRYAMEKYRNASIHIFSDEEFVNREWAMATFSAWIKGLKESFSASEK